MNHLTLLNLFEKDALVQIASMLLNENVSLKSRLEKLEPRLEQKAIQPIEELYSNVDTNNIVLRKLFVRNISFKATPRDLAIAFSKYGNVEYAKIQYQINRNGYIESRGYGFIIYSDTDSANRALRDKVVFLDGRPAECYLSANGEVRPANTHH